MISLSKVVGNTRTEAKNLKVKGGSAVVSEVVAN